MQQVLALLLLRLNHVVPTSDLVDELWGQEPPNSAMTTLQSYIYRLRQLIRDDPSISISTRAHGYALTAPRGDSDLIDFERLAAEGRKALDHGEPERAAPILAEALRLWRGPALSGMTTGELLQAQVTRLEESRLHALERRLEADLALGRHQELVSELKALSSKWPMHEGFHAKLMVALDGAGRRVEALEVYQQVRQVLVEELGLEPSPMLRRLHQTLLSDDRP
ncbi:MAG: AfsR/SARP family transcriptional regulator, partial [Nonomuraea sp.]|nr:AfsR/SARP family transcriptional regulator [Nonomuraea sp.]